MCRLFFNLFILVIGLFCIKGVMAIQEPQYEVLLKEKNFEIRSYQPMLIAEVLVEGDMDEASNKGFRLLADYIFGNNEDPIKRQNQKIGMTAPVILEANFSQPIAMTAPVVVQRELSNMETWKLFFVMPKEYDLNNIPKPKNSQINLVQLPKQYLAVISFSGWVSREKYETKTAELMNWIGLKSYRSLGQAQLSRYNPPWTLPFFRRNEVWIKLDFENSGLMK